MSRVPARHGAAAVGLALVLLLAGVASAGAQDTGTIQGQVTVEQSGEPLAGVMVQVVGTTLSSVTGTSGRFLIRGVPTGARQVRVSSIGYGSAETTLAIGAGQTVNADFQLARKVIALDALVVTGTAGAQRKTTLGNSVGTIQAAELEQAPVANVTELLTARTPGLTLMSNSGQAGANSNIRIRGAGSLYGGYQPVFYVDGVRIESGQVEGGSLEQGGSALDFLNPDDIESIEVLKGPAAATLYGADAANGVIQIITKKGRRGAESVQWTAKMEVGQTEWTRDVGANTTYWRCTTANQSSNSYPGCQDPSAVEWWGRGPDGEAKLFTGIPESDIIDVGDGTFILKDDPLFRDPNALRKGDSYDLDISARGGTGRAGYFLSFNRNSEDGVFHNNFSRRIGGRANFDVQVTPTIDMSTSFSYARTHLQQPLSNNASNSINRNAMRGRARATRDPWAAGFRTFSPALSNEYDNQNRLERMTVGVTGNWLPFPWFRNRLTLGLDKQNYRETTFYRQDTTGRAPWGTINATGAVTHEIPEIHRWTADYSGSVDTRVNDQVALVTSAGMQLNARTYRGYFAVGEGLVANNLNLVSAAATRSADEQVVEQTSLGFYVQEQVGWRDRLFVTGAVRVDDNSAFGENFSLVAYPKASLSWIVSDEEFFPLRDLADQMKLRFAWGEAGNAPAPFSADRTYTTGQGVAGDVMVNTLVISAYGNPNLKAETGREWEAGFDMSLLDGRAGVEFTYYNQHTLDALVSVPDPGSTGFTGSHLVNVGEIANSGIELLLTGAPLARRNVRWDATLAFSTNNNELVSFNGSRDEIVFGSFADVQRHREGYPLGAFWATDVERDANGEVVLRTSAGDITDDPALGNPTVLNSCRWAPSDPDWDRDAECQDVYMGPSRPTREAAFTNTITLFGNLRLFTQFDYRGGHYQWCAICSINSRSDLNTWDVNTGGTALNPDVSLADVEALRSLQTKTWITKADYIKFREISLNYALPERWTRVIPGQWDVTLSGRNLKIWTKYEGRGDPEVQFDPGSSFTMLDYASTPQTRRLSASMRVRF